MRLCMRFLYVFVRIGYACNVTQNALTKLHIWHTHTHTHTVAIGAGRARGRTVHKLLGRRTRYPAYGAGPVREFTDYGTRARAAYTAER